MRVSFIGIGRLGGALALALSKKQYRIENLVARTAETAGKIAAAVNPAPQVLNPFDLEKLSDSEIIFITTQDGAIEPAAERLSAKLTAARPFVFHTSGSLSSEALRSLRARGCPTASFHPLLSVSDSFAGAQRFAGIYFCLEGERTAVEIGEKIVADLGGKSFSIEMKFKPLYHASAVTSAGHVTALFSVAVEMLAACGLTGEDARKILLPLARSAVQNLETQSPSEALTGTFARADGATLKKHLAAISENVSGEAREIYLQLGRRSLHLAEMQGVSEEKLSAMREILDGKNK